MFKISNIVFVSKMVNISNFQKITKFTQSSHIQIIEIYKITKHSKFQICKRYKITKLPTHTKTFEIYKSEKKNQKYNFQN